MWLFRYEGKKDLGLFLLRIGIGLAFVFHGYPKLFMGGAAGLAAAMAEAGIPGGIVGAYLAGMAEFFGGIALILGILFRPATMIMAFNMLVALLYHLAKGDPFVRYSHAMEAGILFFCLIIIGPGQFALDQVWFKTKRRT